MWAEVKEKHAFSTQLPIPHFARLATAALRGCAKRLCCHWSYHLVPCMLLREGTASSVRQADGWGAGRTLAPPRRRPPSRRHSLSRDSPLLPRASPAVSTKRSVPMRSSSTTRHSLPATTGPGRRHNSPPPELPPPWRATHGEPLFPPTPQTGYPHHRHRPRPLPDSPHHRHGRSGQAAAGATMEVPSPALARPQSHMDQPMSIGPGCNHQLKQPNLTVTFPLF
jgi:hypothetical protein